MHKRLLVLILTALLSLSCGVAAAANYSIGSFYIRTWTFDGGEPRTTFRFTVIDADNANKVVLEDVIESVNITEPTSNFSQASTSPELKAWANVEFQGTDANRDGVIDPDTELAKIANTSLVYEIVSNSSPHDAGNYALDVSFNNGHSQVYAESSGVAAGETAIQLPPVADVAAGFLADGRLTVSWSLQETYPAEDSIEVRVDRFQQDGTQRFIRYSARNLPSDATSVEFPKWQADVIKALSPFISVTVRIYADSGANAAQAAIKGYAVDGTTLTPTEIKPPTIGDVNMDGKVGLEEAINALRVASGIGPLTGEAAAIAAGIAAALDAFNSKDLTTLLAFFSMDYLDDGETYADFQTMIQEEMSDPEFQPMTYSISNIVVDGDMATARADFGGGDFDIFTLRKEMDQWKIYGNQLAYEIDLYSTHQTDGHYFAHVMVFDPKGQIASVSVSGHGLDDVSLVSRPDMDNDEIRWELPDSIPAPDLGTSDPPLYPEYTIAIVDGSAASPYTIRSSITGHVEEFAGNPTATVNTNGSVTFSWTGIPNASGYSIALGNDNGFVWGEHDISPIPADTYSVHFDPDPSLPPGNYHFHIGSHRESESGYDGSFADGTFTIS